MCSLGCGRVSTRRGMCNTHYEQRRTRDVAYGRWQSTLVDAEPVRAHVAALKAAGLGNRRINALSGVSRTSLTALTSGRRCKGTGPTVKVWAHTANKLLSVPIPTDTTMVAGGVNIPSLGTVRRLQALVAIGHSQQSICDHLGWLPGNATRLFNGKQDYVTVSTAAKARVLFNELQLTPGTCERARRRAKKLGWPPPLAWEEDAIDDPAARPDIGQQETVGFVERYTEMRELGYNDLQIVSRWSMKPESLERQLHRYGITPSPALTNLAGTTKHRKRVAS
jgi:hypothetical protein